MQWQINPYIFPMLLSAILASLLALLAWRRRPVPGATTMTVLMLVLTAWSILYAFELAADDLTAKLFWARIQYAAFLFVPVLWLVFVLQYTNQEKMLSRRGIILLAIIPLVTLALVWTTERHGLIYRSVSLDTSQGFSLLALDYGEAFWIQGVYNYFLFLFATAIAFRTFLQSPPLQRAQMGTLLIAALVPLIGNILYVTKLTPWPHLDLGPVLVTFSGLLGVWGLFRYGFLDIMPVARDALIEGMTDSVIVIDTQHRLLDLNTTAQQLIGLTRATSVGRQAAGLIPQWSQVADQLPRAGTLRLELEPDVQLTMPLFGRTNIAALRTKRPPQRLAVGTARYQRPQARRARAARADRHDSGPARTRFPPLRPLSAWTRSLTASWQRLWRLRRAIRAISCSSRTARRALSVVKATSSGARKIGWPMPACR